MVCGVIKVEKVTTKVGITGKDLHDIYENQVVVAVYCGCCKKQLLMHKYMIEKKVILFGLHIATFVRPYLDKNKCVHQGNIFIDQTDLCNECQLISNKIQNHQLTREELSLNIFSKPSGINRFQCEICPNYIAMLERIN